MQIARAAFGQHWLPASHTPKRLMPYVHKPSYSGQECKPINPGDLRQTNEYRVVERSSMVPSLMLSWWYIV